jgi:hypothetical protein
MIGFLAVVTTEEEQQRYSKQPNSASIYGERKED